MMAGKKTTPLTVEERLENALVPADEQPYEVPENWCWTKIGTVANLYRGVSYKKHEGHSEKGKDDCLVMRGGNIKEGEIDISAENIYISKELITDEQYIKKHDIIIVTSTGSTKVIGRAGISFADYNDVAFGAFLTLVRPVEAVHKPYVSYYFQGEMYRNRMRQLASGVNINNIRNEYITDTPIPLAPLSEQKRIVERIESLFAKFDEAKAKLEAALDRFEARKAAILYQAFNGELTEQWRKNNGTPFQWTDGVLLDVLKEKPRNGYSPHPVSYPTKYKSMTLSATTSGVFEPKHYKYIDEEIPEDSYLWMKPGDILIQRANSLEKVGTSAIYTGGYHEFIYPDLMMKLQVRDGVSAEFIAYQLKTETVMTYFRCNATGTAGNMPKINQQTVSTAPVKIPPLEEQREIVRILDAFFAKENAVRKTIEERLEKIELYKKSVLAKAFRGELGTNDPSDQPATELLKQILA